MRKQLLESTSYRPLANGSTILGQWRKDLRCLSQDAGGELYPDIAGLLKQFAEVVNLSIDQVDITKALHSVCVEFPSIRNVVQRKSTVQRFIKDAQLNKNKFWIGNYLVAAAKDMVDDKGE